jgi:hypothetical protein
MRLTFLLNIIYLNSRLSHGIEIHLLKAAKKTDSKEDKVNAPRLADY